MDCNNILVTGGAGFIGVNFVRQISGSGAQRVTILDALTYAASGRSLDGLLSEKTQFVHGDIRDQEFVDRIMEEHEIDCVVHFAAESHVDRSITGPDEFISTNVDGTHTLLKAAKQKWLAGSGSPHRFHHVSTDEVYGTLAAEEPAFSETNQYQPNSPYSASKAASDHLVRAYHHTYGLDVTTTNCSNNYGPFQFPEKLIPLMIVNILHGRRLPIYGDGMQIRDWLYVDDHCRAIELCLDRGLSGEVYNIGGDNERPNIEIVHKLCGLIDARVAADERLSRAFPECRASVGGSSLELLEHVNDRPGHDRRYAIDFQRAKRELGYVPLESFESGFEKTVTWYLENEQWWRSVMDGSYKDWLEANYRER